MIILCVISILLGTGGLAYGVWTKATSIKANRYTAEENQKLEELNQSLHATRKSLEAQNDLLIKSNNEISQKYEENCKKTKNSYDELNQLTQQKLLLIDDIQIKQIEKAGIEAQITTLSNSIETMSSDLKAAARASFEQYCDTLDYEYQKREQEFDNDIAKLDELYFTRMLELDARENGLIEEQHQDLDILVKLFYDKQQSMSKELQEEEAAMRADLDSIRKELDKIRATKAAAMEAQLREEEIKNQATFYTLQLNEADKRDVAYLQSIEYNLREPRPLRMLIWSTFYRDKVNDLAARVGALGASGIYKITHIDSGISYIGQAKDIKERWITHVKCSLGIDTPVTSQLYAFTREKGIDNFTFEILEKCSINELNEKEKFYIDLYQTYDFGLNKTRGNS